MIAFLEGRVVDVGPAHCVLEVGGIGLRLSMSTSSLADLPSEGGSVRLHTHLHVREDELSLFGFVSNDERRLFEQLITVSGVGPKVALAALSTYAPAVLAEAIASEDGVMVSSVPGIGAKTAQRIILELKDKMGISVGTLGASRGEAAGSGEARQALLAMGFSPAEVAVALQDVDSGLGLDDIVRHGLKRLGGGS